MGFSTNSRRRRAIALLLVYPPRLEAVTEILLLFKQNVQGGD
jgi:hypothetical protein